MSRGGLRVKWTDFADEVIETWYATHGAKHCQRLLPDRTLFAIQQRAHKLRVVSQVNPAAQQEGPLYPRDAEEVVCDYALQSFREVEPAANLFWIIGAVA